jgi:hypothetical protein
MKPFPALRGMLSRDGPTRFYEKDTAIIYRAINGVPPRETALRRCSGLTLHGNTGLQVPQAFM